VARELLVFRLDEGAAIRSDQSALGPILQRPTVSLPDFRFGSPLVCPFIEPFVIIPPDLDGAFEVGNLLRQSPILGCKSPIHLDRVVVDISGNWLASGKAAYEFLMFLVSFSRPAAHLVP
jgi:hypothetical protein